MRTEEAWRKRVHRAARMARIIERMERMDSASLEELEQLTHQVVLDPRARKPDTITRRDFLRAAAAGGALVATTGGLAIWQLGSGRLTATQEEIEALRELASLYAQMDSTGLDDRLTAGLETLGSLITSVRAAAESLSSGLAAGRAALQDFQSHFPSLQAAFQWLQQTAATLSQRTLALENSVNDLLSITGPLKETIGGFLGWLLDQLPLSAAETAREGLERTGEAVSALPDLLEGLYSRILEPMRDWFSPRPTAGLNGQLVTPLLAGVINPAETLMEQLTSLATTWEEEWVGPVQQALEQRREIRAQIRHHRETYEL